jgi:hypothetical protein
MAFLIGGHPRSGTTLLFRLCRNHPQIGITGEFKCFLKLDVPHTEYLRAIESDWRHVSFFWRIGRRAPWHFKLASGVFLALFQSRLRRVSPGTVTLAAVERTLRDVLRKPVVGDKYPHYVFHLPALVRQPDLRRVIIYRDARDVASSFLKMVRSNWKNLAWAQEFRTAGDVARSWVRAIETMEAHADRVLAIRYEELVADPGPSLRRMAEYLRVDPSGFRTGQIHDRSVGKYEKGLTPSEAAEVLAVAGPTMNRLEYL